MVKRHIYPLRFNQEQLKNRSDIIIVGLYRPGTGFTRLISELCNSLSSTFQIHWIGIGYKGLSRKEDKIKLYPNNLDGGDIYGGFQARALAEKLSADFVLIVNDLWMLKNYRISLGQTHQYVLAAYVPLDGDVPVDSDLQDLSFFDAFYAYHFRGINQLRKVHSFADQSIRFNYFYHGINRSHFYPLEDKLKLRNQIFGIQYPSNAVFILNANRINERKNLKCTLTAFKLLTLKVSDSVYLVLHVPETPNSLIGELKSQLNALGLPPDRVLINPLGHSYLLEQELNRLYNACQIGINTSFGEGWGMVAFEHAATGAAQLVPDHSAPASLWPSELRIKTAESVYLTTNPLRLKSVDAHHLSATLVKLVNEPQILLRLQRLSMKVAQKPVFQWPVIAEKWTIEIEEAISNNSSSPPIIN
ncbi:MAG: glycosyltransferase [Saprospiraceae bacterium]|nr:glycosyltransferase [Saprospiraceae bacterium]